MSYVIEALHSKGKSLWKIEPSNTDYHKFIPSCMHALKSNWYLARKFIDVVWQRNSYAGPSSGSSFRGNTKKLCLPSNEVEKAVL